ncbi:MAG: ATP-binding protein [Pseudomonadota bacterium]
MGDPSDLQRAAATAEGSGGGRDPQASGAAKAPPGGGWWTGAWWSEAWRSGAWRSGAWARVFSLDRARGLFQGSKKRRRSALLAIALAVLGPILAIGTYAALASVDPSLINSVWFRALIIFDLIYLTALIALIIAKIARLVKARRARAAGARLHGRMVAVFSGVAAAPTVLVAIFFFLIIQFSFQGLFSEQVGSVVRSSHEVARAYRAEHRQAMASQTLALGRQISAVSSEYLDGVRDPRFAAQLNALTEEAPFEDVFIIDRAGRVIVRGEFSFLFTFTAPTAEEMRAALNAPVVIRRGRDRETMRALARLESDAYLYVTRAMRADVANVLDLTDSGVRTYNLLEEQRGALLAQMAALYLGFAVLVLLAAIYLGLWFAERLARPIARLAEAAERVRGGDLTVRVKEERSEDDLALLSRAFNKMTDEVRRKQEALAHANAVSEARRNFSEAVVLGVPAGVIGLDRAGAVQVMNGAAADLLDVEAGAMSGRALAEIAPEFAALLSDAALDPVEGVERQIRLLRGEVEYELLARVTTQRSANAADGVSGFVLTIDDLTALNSAQRLAAWGDVARRVAHEIKNPLTPIQLAAERLRRKYAAQLGDDAEGFERYVETIVRQTADIGRMVDAFVRFAKMPTPNMAFEMFEEMVREAVLLQREGRSHIAYSVELETDEQSPGWRVRCDRGQINQALTNLLTNAADAIEARLAEDEAAAREPAPPEIRIRLFARGLRVYAEISDNGVGLPVKDRRRLLEPYVTTRTKGTGLGLAIVSKILEEHNGALELTEAHAFAEGAKPGACVRLSLSLVAAGDETLTGRPMPGVESDGRAAPAETHTVDEAADEAAPDAAAASAARAIG